MRVAAIPGSHGPAGPENCLTGRTFQPWGLGCPAPFIVSVRRPTVPSVIRDQRTHDTGSGTCVIVVVVSVGLDEVKKLVPVNLADDAPQHS